jgi:hypothetical protein
MLITENIVRLIENEIISQMKKNEYITILQLIDETGLTRNNIQNAMSLMQKKQNTIYKVDYFENTFVRSKKIIIKL